MYTTRCTVYNVHYALCSVQYTLYTAQTILISVQGFIQFYVQYVQNSH